MLSNWLGVSRDTVSALASLEQMLVLIVLDLMNRQFISNTYPTLKQHNPDLPILIREAKGTPARVFARFGACLVFLTVIVN